MSESELGLIKGLVCLCIIAMVLRTILYVIFIKTLSVTDKETLDKALNSDEYVKLNEIAKHTTILAVTIHLLGLSVFVNSAIIGAIGLRSLL